MFNIALLAMNEFHLILGNMTTGNLTSFKCIQHLFVPVNKEAFI